MLFGSLGSTAQKIVPYHGPFPEPLPTKTMLFYLQRSIDRNTIIYELNYGTNGTLNTKHPVKAYWIDFENGAKISPLTLAQSKFAYGIESVILDEAKGIFELSLVSYKKIKLYLMPVDKFRYEVHTTLKGKPVVLQRIFVNIVGGTYFKPQVAHVELSGKDLKTTAPVSEKIVPAKD